jgi:hypothetical protein
MTRVSIALAVIIACSPVLAGAQSLADVARAEEARRKTVEMSAAKKTAKVYTNNNLKPDNSLPSGTAPLAPAATTPAVPGATPADGSKPPAADTGDAAAPARGQAYWSGRMGEARAAIERSRMFAEALQSRINALTTDFTNRDDPAQRSVIEQDRKKALEELDRVKKDLADQAKAITAIEDEARRAGVPPGWLR